MSVLSDTRAASLSSRDRAILRAVAAGSAQLTGGAHPVLYVDGLPCCDQFAAYRLVEAGLLVADRSADADHRAPAHLTPAGQAALHVDLTASPPGRHPAARASQHRPPRGPSPRGARP